MKGEGRLGSGILEYGSIGRKPAAPSSSTTHSLHSQPQLSASESTNCVQCTYFPYSEKSRGTKQSMHKTVPTEKRAVGDGAPSQFMDIIG